MFPEGVLFAQTIGWIPRDARVLIYDEVSFKTDLPLVASQFAVVILLEIVWNVETISAENVLVLLRVGMI